MILDNKFTLIAVIGVHCALFYQLSQHSRPSAPTEPIFMQAMPLAMGPRQAEPQVQEQKPLPKVRQKIKEVRQKVQERVAKSTQIKTTQLQPETPDRAATLEVAAAKNSAQRDEPLRGEAKTSNEAAVNPSGGQEGQSKQVEPVLSAPSFHANYLSNPKPPYPPASLALNEQGVVYLRVQVNAAGLPEKIELHKSSGFARLDAVAQSTVQRWRFVPAKRGDEPVAGSVVVPVNFSIKKS
ncbi:energy transducer TonB [Chitinibacter fontanus]|uniref:Energy transducer TonB n=1 Tax=Chitinibacter fontanus TaxID=1737446 RepID=A0A7D5V8Q6_9NEIS|nr:energy transducer TonB [Chitinibacter fontanus]QLI80173.1 energy transducer TonB [Chitinibacter fontanus]